MSADDGFTIIPNSIFALGNAHAIAVYAAIARHKGENGIAFPSHDRLCKLTGLGRTTVIKTVDLLVAAGCLERQHRASRGMKRSNEYRLPPHNFNQESNANVQMSATETSMFATRTLDVRHADFGCSPDGHEVEPIELDPGEVKDIAKTSPKGKPKRSTSVPGDFTLSDGLRAWGEKHGFSVALMEAQIEQFVDHYQSKGETRKDWDASFRTWMRNGKDWNRLRPVIGNVDRSNINPNTGKPYAWNDPRNPTAKVF